MPCQSYGPAEWEIELTKVNQHLTYIHEFLGRPFTKFDTRQSNVDLATDRLCAILREFYDRNYELFEEIVYNARDKDSRKLADWWEHHEEVDRKRRDKEDREARHRDLMNSVKAKLTADEYQAVMEDRWR